MFPRSNTVSLTVENRSKIEDIPPELLSTIFEAVKNQELEENEDADFVDIRTTPFEILISTVSPHFRRIAIATPGLWASILVNADTSSHHVQLYLARSTSIPLDIRVDVGLECVHYSELAQNVLELVALVLPHSHRWRRLSIDLARESVQMPIVHLLCNAHAPVLEHLSISVGDVDTFNRDILQHGSQEPSIFEHGTPMLSFLRLRGLAMYLYRPPLNELTVFHLDQTLQIPISWTLFKDIITASSTLTHLSIYGDIIGGEDWPADPNYIDLLALRSLRICGTAGQVYTGILLCINAPNLESLILKHLQEDDLRRLWTNPSNRRCFPQVKNLTFCDFEVSGKEYKNLFLSFPSITSFCSLYSSVGESQLPTLLQTHGRLLETPWPDLHSMTFLFDFRDDEGCVNDMVSNREEWGHSLRQLRFATSQKDQFSRWSDGLEVGKSVAIVMMKTLDEWPEPAIRQMDSGDDLFDT